jgi:hypothetical protein
MPHRPSPKLLIVAYKIAGVLLVTYSLLIVIEEKVDRAYNEKYPSLDSIGERLYIQRWIGYLRKFNEIFLTIILLCIILYTVLQSGGSRNVNRGIADEMDRLLG